MMDDQTPYSTGEQIARELDHPFLRHITIDREVVAKNVRARLAVLGITQADAAMLAGVSRQLLHHRLANAPITVTMLRWLATLLVVPAWSLVEPATNVASGYPVPPKGWHRIIRALMRDTSWKTLDYDSLWAMVYSMEGETP